MADKPVQLAQPRQLLARILEEPELVTAVQSLDAEVLGKVISHIGLEDAGEIVALATAEQLTQIFDQDLWRAERPGKEETFDTERFAIWLEVMLEMGAPYAAKRLAQMDEDFVTFALAGHVLVVDVDELTPHMAEREGRGNLDDEDLIDKALESSLSHQFAQYLVISRHHEGWDAILSLLVALDSEHHGFFARVIDRLCHISRTYIEDSGGLYDVLSSGEMLESDVAFAREKRREQEGFVPPQEAAAFLGLARISTLEEMMESRQMDPITTAHFRALAPRVRSAAANTASPPSAPRRGGIDALVQVVEEAGGVATWRQQRLELASGVAAAEAEQELPLRDGLRQLGAGDADAPAERVKELNYLANLLMSGCHYEDRSLRPLEAARAAVAVCNLGLEQLLAGARQPAREALAARAAAMLAQHDLVKMFRIGWHIQHQRVVLYAAQKLCDTLGEHVVGAIEDQLAAGEIKKLCAGLHDHLSAGKPWLSWQRLDVLADLLDPAAMTAVKALVDECARVPRLAGRGATRQLTAALDFLARQKQLDDVRWVVARLQDDLRRAATRR